MNNTADKERIAGLIQRVFDSYLSEFLIITRHARMRFEEQDWRGGKRDAAERLGLYEKVLSQISTQVEGLLGPVAFDRSFWIGLKPVFARLIAGKVNEDLAETFFNSVTRILLRTVGIDREVEFFHLHGRLPPPANGLPIFTRYERLQSTKDLIRKVVEDRAIRPPFECLERDLDSVANEMDLYLWPLLHQDQGYAAEILNPCFYRNKAAYIVGRILAGSRTIPIILPLYNTDRGVHIDTILMEDADADNVFGFAYSYFHVAVETPSELVGFLTTILPHKPLSDLYNAIGFYKHGKTEFYRDLHRLVHVLKEQFEIAPGMEGAVMIVFTLPRYHHVFKVIKDRPCFIRSGHITDKVILKEEVRRRYRFVTNRDRVGRLVDTQEFENIRFKAKRYSPQLLREFELAGHDAVTIQDGYVVIHHLYLQRKVTPLPIYFREAQDTRTLRNVIIDFGYFLKDLAATGLFPADLFNTWNYGVTEGNRVVLFDYDDVIPLESAQFRNKPSPMNEFEELKPEEEWMLAEPTDFFLEEMEHFVGIPQPLRGIFQAEHSDLFTMEYWRDITERVRDGEIIDTIPYERSKRFSRFSRET